MGWTELAVILLVALLVIKPKEMPKLVRGFGRLMARIREISDAAKQTIEDELKQDELSKNEKRAAKADKYYQKHHE